MPAASRPANLDLDTLRALQGELDEQLPCFNFVGGEQRQRAIDEWLGVSWARCWIGQHVRAAEGTLGIDSEIDPEEQHARAAREHLERTRAPLQSTLARGAVPAREERR